MVVETTDNRTSKKQATSKLLLFTWGRQLVHHLGRTEWKSQAGFGSVLAARDHHARLTLPPFPPAFLSGLKARCSVSARSTPRVLDAAATTSKLVKATRVAVVAILEYFMVIVVVLVYCWKRRRMFLFVDRKL